jgi:glycosyltransferase 2 family protein
MITNLNIIGYINYLYLQRNGINAPKEFLQKWEILTDDEIQVQLGKLYISWNLTLAKSNEYQRKYEEIIEIAPTIPLADSTEQKIVFPQQITANQTSIQKLTQKQIVQYLIFMGLAVFLMWYVVKDIDIADLQLKIKEANPLYIYLIAFVGIMSIAFRAWRWQILIEPIEKKPSFINTFLSIFIGYGVNFVTPRLGEIAKCGVLAKYENMRADKLAGTIIAERLIDLLSLLIVAIITFVLEFSLLKNALYALIDKIKMAIAGKEILLLIIIFAIILVGYFAVKKLRNATENKFAKIILNLKEGVMSIFKMKNAGMFLLHSIGIWSCYLGMTYIGFLAFKNTAHLGFAPSFSVLTLGSLGFIVTPGGTGSYQLIVENILTQFYDVEVLTAKAYAMLSWALQNGILLVGAVVALVVFPMVNRKK